MMQLQLLLQMKHALLGQPSPAAAAATATAAAAAAAMLVKQAAVTARYAMASLSAGIAERA